MPSEDAPHHFEDAETTIRFGDQQEFTLLSITEETNADETLASLTLFFKEIDGSVRAIQLAQLATIEDLTNEGPIVFVDEVTPLTAVEVLTRPSEELRRISIFIDL